MESDMYEETFEEKPVTYTIELEGEFVIVENVPARVCVETGETLFAPETVDRLQKMIWHRGKPKRVVEAPVYDFAV